MRFTHSVATLALLAGWTSAAHAQFSIPWSTVDGGGGRSTGGAFSITGTIGQPDAGSSSGGTFIVNGGFWSLGIDTSCPADLDDDGVNPPNPDGGVTIDDLLFFLLRFEAGC